MSTGNYSNIENNLIDETRQDKTLQFSDIENLKLEFLKNTLQGVGSLGVGSQLTTGLKALRSKLKGGIMEKYGLKSEDLDELQESMEAGNYEKSISILGNKLTQKMTDSGRNLLSGIKNKLENLNKPSEPLDADPIEIQRLTPEENIESEAFNQPDLVSVENQGLGRTIENGLKQFNPEEQLEKTTESEAAATEDLGDVAAQAAEAAAKKAALTGVKDELGGALAELLT